MNIEAELSRQTLNSEKKGVALIDGGFFSTEDQKREIELETEKGHYFARVWAKTAGEIANEVRQAANFVRQAKP